MKREYSIKDLERLSGIKAHTIRIWEKRYQLLEPNRTATNIRFYDDAHLKRILDVTILQKKGLKISKISRLTEDELKDEVHGYYKTAIEEPTSYEAQIHELVKATIELDEPYFEKVFNGLVLKRGLEKTMRGVIFPFMIRIGALWNIGEIHPGHEHFVSNLVKQKLFSAIDGLVLPKGEKGLCLLYLIENELHEISLLFAAYMLKSKGKEVVYLGQSVPMTSLEAIIQDRKPDQLFTVFTTNRPVDEFQDHLDQVDHLLDDIELTVYAAPHLSGDLKVTNNMILVSDFEVFVD